MTSIKKGCLARPCRLGRGSEEEQMEEVLDYVQTTFVTQPRRELKPRNIPERESRRNEPTSPLPAAKRFTSGAARDVTVSKATARGRTLPTSCRDRETFVTRDFIDSLGDRRILESILYGVQGTAMPPWIDYGLSHERCR